MGCHLFFLQISWLKTLYKFLLEKKDLNKVALLQNMKVNEYSK